MAEGLQFYVDESLLGLGKSLSYARKDVVYPGHPGFPQVVLGTRDEDWIPVVVALRLITIIRDRRIVTRWWENEKIISSKLCLIHIVVRHDLTNWGYLRLLLKHWDRIEAEIAKDIPGPWRIAVHDSKIETVPIAPRRPTGPRPV